MQNCGITTFEEEILAHIVLLNGKKHGRLKPKPEIGPARSASAAFSPCST
jgi:hypothetical protein